MSFNNFCNICFIKEHIIKLCLEENESILNILISFTSSQDTLKGIIYLCINCCNKLEEYNKFRELFLTNFVRFRYLYNVHKKQLQIGNAPDIETKLKAFVEINVQRVSGTPLIENYEIAHALRNDTTCNVDINYKELDGEFTKVDLHELLNKNDLSHAGTSFRPESNISENQRRTRQVKCENNSFDDQENVNGSSIYMKDEPNPALCEELQDPLVSDTVANVIPCHESADDTSDVSFNPEDCVTCDSTDEEGSTNNENKTTSDTVCNVCNESFSCKSDLEVHARTHTGGNHYNCDKCNKTFIDAAKLKIHKRLHSSKRPYKCDDCGLRFPQLYHLNRHKHIHTGEKPFKCGECGMGFSQRYHLNTHERTHTGEKPYKCDECGMVFARRDQVSAHKLVHTGEKLYKCNECGVGFKKNSHLKIHKLRHAGEKPFKCDKCGLGFTQRYHLNTHERTHTGEKPYKCDECGLGFARRDQLIPHKLRHTGEKPYKCEECGLGFTRRDHLSAHKVTHTGEKPYKCDWCNVGFGRRFDLKRHTRRHTGIEAVFL